MKKITLLVLAFFCTGVLFAQQRDCSTMENLEYRKQLDPQLEARMQQIEDFTRQRIQEMGPQESITGNIISIPVVVHVIYNNANENISAAQIQSQIDVMNEDFRRTNADADNTWSQAADTEIQFCLATVDPNGNPTTGITRKSSSTSAWGTNDAMKRSSSGGVNPWNASEYLNMWVCNIGGGILGYAQFPGGSSATDGVVMGPQYFGSSAKGSGFYLSAPFDLGRTTTHEVGHYLNLRHIWGDGGCSVDDFVSDTPTSDGANYGCASTHVSCSSTDMVQNYMDYSDDGCMNLYTAGQKARMRAILNAGGSRRSLALSDKCGSTTPPTPTCTDGIQNGDETGVDCGGSSCAPCQTSCSGAITSYPYSEGFENTLGGWTQSSADDINWTVDASGTPSSGTGPSSASQGTYYVYVEASGTAGYPTKQAILNSPCFDLSGETQATFDFKYHMYGATSMGSILLEASTNNGATWTSLWSQTGNKGNSWLSASVDLAAYVGGSVQLRFNRTTGSTWQADIAIDDVSLTTSGGGGPSCSNASLSITFDNYPEETSWEITNSGGSVVASGGTYGSQADGSTLNIAVGCLPDGCYNFTITDAYGDGICCSYGNGSFTLTNTSSGATLASGGSFTTSDTTNFCLTSGARYVTTSDDTTRASFEVQIYPNPVKGGVLNVRTLEDNANYTITNIMGQQIAKGKITSGAINVERLQRGVYMIQIEAGSKIVTKKFIKE